MLQSKTARDEFSRAIVAMKAEADKLGVPFILVVFPDRVAVDKELREQLKVSTDQIAVLRSLYALGYQTLPDTPVLEVAEALQGEPPCTARTIRISRIAEI